MNNPDRQKCGQSGSHLEIIRNRAVVKKEIAPVVSDEGTPSKHVTVFTPTIWET